jgi:hypothetical protein
MGTALIRLERQAAWLGRVRAFHIFLDGKKSGTIRYLESRIFEVQPGPHEIFLKVDWLSSPHLSMNLASGEEMKLICEGNDLAALLWPYFFTFGYRQCIKLYQQ